MEHNPPQPQDGAAASLALSGSAIFNLDLVMTVDRLTAVRRFVTDLGQTVSRNPDVAARLALATHELMENALKYSADPTQRVTLVLSAESGPRLCVTVCNVSNEALVVPLRQRLRELHEAPDPVAHYYRLLTCSTSNDMSSGELSSGLGLARIVAEAEMELSCELRGDLLAVKAQALMGEGK